MLFPRNGQTIFFSCQSWLLQHSICFSFLMQSQNGFSYLFVNAAVVPAFICHRRVLEEEKNEFCASTFDAAMRCNYSMESWSVDRSLIHLFCHFLIFTSHHFSTRLIFNIYSDRNLPSFFCRNLIDGMMQLWSNVAFAFYCAFLSINKCDYIHRWCDDDEWTRTRLQ